MTAPRIELTRLTGVPVEEVAALLNEPRNAPHMPLVGEPFTVPAAEAWVGAKDAQWAEHGYGPWAVMVDDRFVGWGGFQHEEAGADLALVALPYSRTSPDRALARWGFEPAGETTFGEVVFRQYRLTADDWRAALGGR